jgi:hypothetical protein
MLHTLKETRLLKNKTIKIIYKKNTNYTFHMYIVG